MFIHKSKSSFGGNRKSTGKVLNTIMSIPQNYPWSIVQRALVREFSEFTSPAHATAALCFETVMVFRVYFGVRTFFHVYFSRFKGVSTWRFHRDTLKV